MRIGVGKKRLSVIRHVMVPSKVYHARSVLSIVKYRSPMAELPPAIGNRYQNRQPHHKAACIITKYAIVSLRTIICVAWRKFGVSGVSGVSC